MKKVLLVATFVLLFTECSVAASVNKPSPTNSSQDCPNTQQGEGCTLGLTKEQPADSCYHIFTCNPQGQSGMYWIRNGPTAGEGAHQFFCELEEERCRLRGLMRVAHINLRAVKAWHGGLRNNLRLIYVCFFFFMKKQQMV